MYVDTLLFTMAVEPELWGHVSEEVPKDSIWGKHCG